MTDGREDHGDAMFIRGSDHFRIAYGTARLDDGSGTGIGHDVQAVPERDECIGCHNRTLKGKSGVGRFHGGGAGGIDTAHLTGTDTECHSVATENDGIGFDEFDDFGGEQHILHLLRGRLFFRHDFQIGRNDIDNVRRLDEQASSDPFEIERIGVFAKGDLEKTQVFLAVENAFGFFRESRCNQYFHEQFGYFFRRTAIEFSIECDDTAESRFGIGLQRFPVGVQQIFSGRDTTGVGMFDDDAGRFIEVLDAFPVGIRICYIVL